MTVVMNSRAVPLLERYEVNTVTGCWLWAGYTNPDGYARAGSHNAHRLFYIEYVGPVPEGYDVDHLCKRRNCVNPEHLEAVTEAENNRRKTPHVVLAGRGFKICREGHLITGRNVAIVRRAGAEYERCWLCSRSRDVVTTVYKRRVLAEADASGLSLAEVAA